MLRSKIKKKIKDKGSVNAFADTHNIRRASLVDYLNGKKDVTTRLFFKIIEPLNITVVDNDLKE
jgi:hypothetical protein